MLKEKNTRLSFKRQVQRRGMIRSKNCQKQNPNVHSVIELFVLCLPVRWSCCMRTQLSVLNECRSRGERSGIWGEGERAGQPEWVSRLDSCRQRMFVSILVILSLQTSVSQAPGFPTTCTHNTTQRWGERERERESRKRFRCRICDQGKEDAIKTLASTRIFYFNLFVF